ncbi:MAG: thrombospondin type 3 repeat-containing protein, partial [Verrucomicrobiota bacterium]
LNTADEVVLSANVELGDGDGDGDGDGESPAGWVMSFQTGGLEVFELAAGDPFQNWVTRMIESQWSGRANPDEDPDGDGQTNWEEYLAGTDPLDVESLLRITAVTPTAWGQAEVRWTSVPGRHYRVETASEEQFADGRWEESGELTALLDESVLVVSSPEKLRFYRLKVSP